MDKTELEISADDITTGILVRTLIEVGNKTWRCACRSKSLIQTPVDCSGR